MAHRSEEGASPTICCGCLVTLSFPTFCYPMDCSPPGPFVHGILQERILAWVAISFSRGSNPGLLHRQADSLLLSQLRSPHYWFVIKNSNPRTATGRAALGRGGMGQGCAGHPRALIHHPPHFSVCLPTGKLSEPTSLGFFSGRFLK